ncbi:hypothetical protein KCP69_25120 [Salmonella enterica subsp. enterica]|nr:hypothetical protein KCP69_25120 [Salmonella enterica subsp. enterica]
MCQTSGKGALRPSRKCQGMQSERRCLFFDAGDNAPDLLSSTLTKRRGYY